MPDIEPAGAFCGMPWPLTPMLPGREPAGAGFAAVGAAEALAVAAGVAALGSAVGTPARSGFTAEQPGIWAAGIFIPSGMVIMPCASPMQLAGTAFVAGTAADVAPGVGDPPGESALAVPPATSSNPSAPAPVSRVRPTAAQPGRIGCTAERAILCCLTDGPPRQARAATA
jgi:hypothetical protein